MFHMIDSKLAPSGSSDGPRCFIAHT